ncbi:esterase [Lentzea sp. NBRC 105346]|uniref:alpha/beta hydrolase n=1 Tax=Lentzea sp. NBRC 105346 TaxID=3032205 RepID=UPI0024A4425A|nr:alpha/beta hydrolase-fold protein [Lentzea sp. NBRC 105346]GLZ32721.1 esterase [Lentzea sp. NBRC 105346]
MGEPRFSRRTLLASIGAVGLTAAGVALKVSSSRTPLSEAISPAGNIAASAKSPDVRVERVFSQARGRYVDLMLVLPGGVSTAKLPMSILLHGLHGDARHAACGGLPQALNSAVARGTVPPFGFVAVDGGDHYWHENVAGDDPMKMLLDEVPGWLRERGLAEPFACTGVSMGGFGALLYARRRLERGTPLGAVATIAPALITSWTEMRKRRAFTNESVWADMDPLKHLTATGSTPVGVWIGDRDQFVGGARRFIADVHPAVGHIGRGGHNDDFYKTVTPDVVRFLGKHAKRAV